MAQSWPRPRDWHSEVRIRLASELHWARMLVSRACVPSGEDLDAVSRRCAGLLAANFGELAHAVTSNSVNDSLPTTEYRMCNLAVHLMASSQSILNACVCRCCFLQVADLRRFVLGVLLASESALQP